MLRALEGLAPRRGEVSLFSTVTGEVTDGADLEPAYWVRNLREPVLLAPVVERLANDGHSLFVEVSPELAEKRGLHHGGWATVLTSRSAVEARVLVTERMKPIEVQGQVVDQVGIPWHWGSKGLTRGDSANDLISIVLDPNVHIQEVKAASCDIRPGRRPRGRALRDAVETLPKIEHGEERV